jgi:peptidoglycan/LPS O-acetylase OafA/YrhL
MGELCSQEWELICSHGSNSDARVENTVALLVVRPCLLDSHPGGRRELMTDRSQTKMVGIEFLRFVCAFAVLIWHYQHFAFTSRGIDVRPNLQPLYRLFKPAYSYGYMGVKVFWCISGFIFFFRYFVGLTTRKTGFREFFVNRLSRLYPLHALTLIVVVMLQSVYRTQNGYDFVYHFNDLKHFVLNIFFASDWWRENNASFNGPIWSVSVEMIVYIVFFVVVSRLKLGWAYLLSLLLALAAGLAGWHDFSECLLYFFVGGAIAICRFFPSEISRREAIQRFAHQLLGIFLAVLTVVFSLVRPGIYAFDILICMVVSCVVYIFVSCNHWFAPLSRAGNFLGNLTYSSYLIHFPLQLALVVAMSAAGLRVEYTNPMLLSTFLTTTLLLSAIAYRYFEVPAQKLIRARFLATKELPAK